MALRFNINSVSASLSILKLEGTFESIDAANIRQGLLAAVSEFKAMNLFIDLADIEYIDSMAISVLIDLAKALQQKAVNASLIHVHPHVRKVLEVTKVDKIIPIETAI